MKNQDETDIDCGGGKCSKCNNGMMCNVDCDCISDICRENKCIPIGSCTDNVKNQDESDVDCGGIKCPMCENGKACNRSSDCISNICKNNQCSREY
ncbi:unnamed protein product [Adineta ricciae]|nr:unnamed protein product [Adineta ricciae]